jgi:hypothetical protein
MEATTISVLLGALLVIVGMLQMAYEAIWKGRLSGASHRRTIKESTTLEPKGRSAAFDPKANWPGIALTVLGVTLLFVGVF